MVYRSISVLICVSLTIPLPILTLYLYIPLYLLCPYVDICSMPFMADQVLLCHQATKLHVVHALGGQLIHSVCLVFIHQVKCSITQLHKICGMISLHTLYMWQNDGFGSWTLVIWKESSWWCAHQLHPQLSCLFWVIFPLKHQHCVYMGPL